MNGSHDQKRSHWPVQAKHADPYIGISRGEMQTKVCYECGIEKPITNFFKRNSENYECMCKSCRMPKHRVAQGRVTHKDRLTYGATCDLTTKELELILKSQDNCCVLCGRDFNAVEPTFDCIIPMSKGGSFTKENVQALCKSCNSRKNVKILAVNRHSVYNRI